MCRPTRPARSALDEAWRCLTGGQAGTALSLHLLGRSLLVPRATKGVARFTFEELCGQPLGSVDYLKPSPMSFHTLLIVDGIPIMPTMTSATRSKRLIILIDTLLRTTA